VNLLRTYLQQSLILGLGRKEIFLPLQILQLNLLSARLIVHGGEFHCLASGHKNNYALIYLICTLFPLESSLVSSYNTLKGIIMIIGLGYKARVGKDTTAEYLVKTYNFAQESFAWPLKEYIGRQICGFNDRQLYGDLKEVIDPEWGMTPRQMLQLIGTDALRKVVHDDFWIIPMKRKIREHIKNNKSVVISDVRFPNEVKLIREFGGLVIRIDRTNPDKISGVEKHSSETELDVYTCWDHSFNNNGTFEELYSQVDGWIERI